MLNDALFVVFSAVLAKDSADNDNLSLKDVALARLLLDAHLQTVSYQSIDNLAVLGVLEIFYHIDGDDFTDTVNLGKFFGRSVTQGVDVLEVSRQQFCRCLAHHAYSECKDHPLEGHLLRGFYGLYDLSCRFLTVALIVKLRGLQLVQVGDVVNQSSFIIGIHRLCPQGVDIHGLAGDEMFYSSLYLWRAARIVGAIVHSLPFTPLQECAANRTVGDEGYRLRIG